MSIGTTIKKLRQEHNMTQEKLADLLGLTPAAVSGWECDRNAPDISQIPQLSHIFGVSADVILGIDLAARDRKIEAIIEKAAFSTPKEAVEIYRLGLAEFPSSYRMMLFLADSLAEVDDPKTYNAREKERIALYEKIREGSNEVYYKNTAEGRLCSIYLRQGKRDKALKIAEAVPILQYSRAELNKMLKEGIDKIHEMHHNIHGEFAALCDDIYFFSMQHIDGKQFFTNEQVITILEKIPKLHEIFYENGDYLDTNWIIAWSNTRIAERYADMGDRKNTVKYIQLAAKHAKAMDSYINGLERGIYGISDVWGYPQFPLGNRHTSILADPNLDYPTTTFTINTNDGESYVKLLKNDLLHERFDFVRDDIKDLI